LNDQALIAELKVGKRGGSPRDKYAAMVDALAPGLSADVEKLAKKQAILHEFRIADTGVFLVQAPTGIDIRSEARFNQYNEGTTQHIYEMLGEIKDKDIARHAMLNLPAFGSLVRYFFLSSF